jgi:hypothetical protein
MGGRITAGVGGVVAIVVATFACRQLVGIGDEPPQGQVSPSTDAGAEGGFTYGQGDCAACVATSCGAQATACGGTPSCAALEGCMSACGTDATCRAQCGVDHGLGHDVATPAFEACLAGSCAAACGLTCGGLAAVFPPATATGCEACILKQECPAVGACATDPECQTAVRCRFSSDTPDVQQACPSLGQDSGATPLFNDTTAPIASSCSTECSWGADWSCVGKVDWPAATIGPIDVSFAVYGGATQAPIAGATVKLCSFGDSLCSNPFSMGITGDAGTVPLLRPSVPSAGLVYVDISSPTILTTLGFEVFPLSEPRLTSLTTGIFTQAQLAFAAAGVGVTLDSALASVIVLAADCRIGDAPGVEFSLAPQAATTRLFYVVNGAFTPTGPTDSSGVAVFFNVPVLPTMLELTVTPQSLGRASGKMPFYARAGGVSGVYAVPTP